MRYAPLPWAIPHAATEAMNYKGLSIKKDDLVYVIIPAANRDPTFITSPDSFDISRKKSRHFAFGAGMHLCPGMRLARMEMAGALEQLVVRFPTLKITAEPT